MTVLLKKNASIKLLAFFILVGDKDAMRCLIAIVMLAFLGFGQSANQTPRATQLMDRFDAFLMNKESGWRSSQPSSRASDGNWRTWKHDRGSQVDSLMDQYILEVVISIFGFGRTLPRMAAEARPAEAGNQNLCASF